MVRPRVQILGSSISSFHVCGCIGLVLAIGVSQLVVSRRGLAVPVMALLTVVAVVTFISLVIVTTLVVGRETLVYFHHEIAVMATGASVLWILDQPVLAYLDALALGVGSFLACGRVGCLLVGCCHGRPARCGVRYGPAHGRDGFFAPYVGVRLVPVPLLESLWVVFVLTGGLGVATAGYPPGAAFACYVTGYAVGRFGLEFLRGDLYRPHLWGLSHNQWVALLLAFLVAAGGWLSILPPGLDVVYEGSFLALALAYLVVGARWRRAARWRDLTHPCHVAEMAALLDKQRTAQGGHLTVDTTSLGVQLSQGSFDQGGLHTHYALSARNGPMSQNAAQCLARAILRIRHPDFGTGILMPGHGEIFHLIVPAPDAAQLLKAGPAVGHDPPTL